MADVVYCPRLTCGTPVMVEPDTTMGICAACQYAFCTLCKLGYHGVSPCKISAGIVLDTIEICHLKLLIIVALFSLHDLV